MIPGAELKRTHSDSGDSETKQWNVKLVLIAALALVALATLATQQTSDAMPRQLSQKLFHATANTDTSNIPSLDTEKIGQDTQFDEAFLTQLQSDIRQLILDNFDQFGRPALISKFARLSFHDCIGGCDGCIEIGNLENKGLQNAVEKLEEIFTMHNGKVSRADIWALAGVISILVGAEAKDANSPDYHVPAMDFWFGRKDCKESPNSITEQEFAHPTFGHSMTLDYFQRAFGFDQAQVTALLGVHTLGGCVAPNSGFSGVWTNSPFVVDNEYYKEMVSVSPGWIQEVNSQWNKVNIHDVEFCEKRRFFGAPFCFLNSDMSLYRKLDPNVFGEPQAGPLVTPGVPLLGNKCHWNLTECPFQDPPQKTRVEEYANDNQKFLDDLADVFGLMIRTGEDAQLNDKLYKVTDDVAALNATP